MTTTSERLRREIEFHREIAPRSEQIWNWDSPAGRRRARRRAELFVEHCALRPGRRALELGCGTGVFLQPVAASGAQIVGVDLSQDLLARARSKLAAAANVHLDCGNAEQLPYPDASFDAVYGSSILHHLDLDRALTETFRVLRPGGLITFAEPNLLSPQVVLMFKVDALKRLFSVSADEMAFTRFRALRALRAAGFVDARARPFDFLHPSVPAPVVPLTAKVGRFLEGIPVLREIAGSMLITARRA